MSNSQSGWSAAPPASSGSSTTSHADGGAALASGLRKTCGVVGDALTPFARPPRNRNELMALEFAGAIGVIIGDLLQWVIENPKSAPPVADDFVPLESSSARGRGDR